MLFENRPISMEKFGGRISYKISYSDHKRFYEFTDPEDTIEDFLNILKHKFVPPGCKVQAKCTFYIQNFEPTPTENMIEVTDSRRWYIDVYKFQFCNR